MAAPQTTCCSPILHLGARRRAHRGLMESGATCIAYETVEDGARACRCSRR